MDIVPENSKHCTRHWSCYLSKGRLSPLQSFASTEVLLSLFLLLVDYRLVASGSTAHCACTQTSTCTLTASAAF